MCKLSGRPAVLTLALDHISCPSGFSVLLSSSTFCSTTSRLPLLTRHGKFSKFESSTEVKDFEFQSRAAVREAESSVWRSLLCPPPDQHRGKRQRRQKPSTRSVGALRHGNAKLPTGFAYLQYQECFTLVFFMHVLACWNA